MSLNLQERYKKMLEVTPNGKLNKKEMITVTEALSTPDASILFPKVINTVMLEAAEPTYLVSKFLTEISLTEGRSIEFPMFGAIRAYPVAEGQEYPEQTLNFHVDKLSTEVKVNKYGLKVKITDEMVSDSQWDVIGMHLKAAGYAMGRLKEELCFYEFDKHGHIVFDADSSDPKLVPTGRDYYGEANGTVTAEDLIDMCTSIMAAGFTPTDIIMHPLCWSLFYKNSILESMKMAAFGAGAPSVNISKEPPQIPINTGSPVGGLNISFSPWVPFDQVNKKFNFYVIDRNNVGVLVVKDRMSPEQFDDPTRDIITLKVKERYGIGILHGGYGIAVAKNIPFKKTYPLPTAYAVTDIPENVSDDI